MITKQFFLDIIKNTPDNCYLLTGVYVDYSTALKYDLVRFKKVITYQIGLDFLIEKSNRENIINIFSSTDLVFEIIHYYVIKDHLLIAAGYDQFYINFFKDDIYNLCFGNFKNQFDIHYESKINDSYTPAYPSIEILNLNKWVNICSADIQIKIVDENLNLRFEIELTDYDILKSLKDSLPQNATLVFQGYLGATKDFGWIGLTIKYKESIQEISIKTSKKLIQNLQWFQAIGDKKLIEKMII